MVYPSVESRQGKAPAAPPASAAIIWLRDLSMGTTIADRRGRIGKTLEGGDVALDSTEHLPLFGERKRELADLGDARVAASKGDESRSGHMKIEATDSKHVNGVIDMTTAHGNMNMKLTGKWLSTSCAGAVAAWVPRGASSRYLR
mgnify:CR=1 FL=1